MSEQDPTLTRAYLALPAASRRDAIHSLMRALTVEDRDHAQNVLMARRDPVLSLPTEVLLRVLDFLHPFDVWSLRGVCARWNRFLSSERPVSAQLARLESYDATTSSLADHTATRRTNKTRLRHIQALRLGRPFTYTEYVDALALSMELHKPSSPLQAYALQDNHIAYLRGLPHQGYTVVLRNVITQETKLFHGDARERILAVALSRERLVYVTYTGILYTAEPSDPGKVSRIRLPSSNIVCLVVDGTMVAALLRNDVKSSTVVLHDSSSRQTTSFAFTHLSADHIDGSWVPAQTLLLDAKDRKIDIFGVALGKFGPTRFSQTVDPHVAHLRFSTTGERIDNSIFTGSGEATVQASRPSEQCTLGAVESMGREHIFGIPLEICERDNTSKRGQILHFDSRTGKLSEIFTMLPGCIRLDDRWENKPIMWKDCCYESSTHGSIVTVRLLRSVLLQTSTVGIIEPQICRRGHTPTAMVMNGSFLAQFSPEDRKILVLCFDEAINMTGAKSTSLWDERVRGFPSQSASMEARRSKHGKPTRSADEFDDRSEREWRNKYGVLKCMPYYDWTRSQRRYCSKSYPVRDDDDEWHPMWDENRHIMGEMF